eukprot:1141387-Pelagomonas_calceolata.AAC.2
MQHNLALLQDRPCKCGRHAQALSVCANVTDMAKTAGRQAKDTTDLLPTGVRATWTTGESLRPESGRV